MNQKTLNELYRKFNFAAGKEEKIERKKLAIKKWFDSRNEIWKKKNESKNIKRTLFEV